MERLLRNRPASFLFLVVASSALPAAVLHYIGNEPTEAPISYAAHFAVIVTGALIAAAAAVGLTVVGARRNDGRAVMVGTAFSAMSALLAVHGLTTEEVIVPEGTGVGAFAGAAALPVAGAVLALSALGPLRGTANVRSLLFLQAVLLSVIAALGAVGLLLPGLVPGVPESGSPAAVALLILSMGFFAILALRAARTYALTRRFADLLVLAGTVWLAAALIPQLLHMPWGWSWWAGHGLELLGVAAVGGPAALDLHRAAQSRPLAGDLRAAELVAKVESFLGARVRALMVRLAEKDAYTEVHTRRVALRAVQVGERLGLSPGRLRSLAIGGLVHDVGKLSVPNSILRKPGPLDEDEYAVIRGHPEWGEELLSELGGFHAEVRRLVLDHHERLDGAGYPRGVSGAQLSLETRILTVCDVYDALISKRVYRDAWSEEDALSLLRRESGTAFDPSCVEALEDLLAQESARPAVAAAANGDHGPQRSAQLPLTVK
ncbi:MAG: HD domain-containing phosphohydrolase [Actinomycetota bacterium]